MKYEQAHRYGTLFLEILRCREISIGIEALRAEIRAGGFEMSAEEMERQFNEIVSVADNHLMDIVSNPKFSKVTREFMKNQY